MGVLHDGTLAFFTALGVVLGGSIVGALATVLLAGSPLHTMLVIAKPIKMWAILAAIGGSFTTIQAIDTGLWAGEVRVLLHQLIVVVCGFFGASAGYWLVLTLAGGE